MKPRIRYAAYSLVGISIALTLLLAFPESNRSRAKARTSAPKALLDPRTVGMDEWKTETVIFKPSPGSAKTWGWETFHFGGGMGLGCDFSSTVKGWGDSTAYFPKVSGQITAGFIHHWDGGSGPFPCQSRVTDEFVGTVWFDLSEVFSKPPLPKAESATLTFKAISSDGPGGVCKDELRLPGDDWMKGLPENTLPKTGSLEPTVYFEGCPSEGCSADVTSIVNNWIKGTEDRYGFAISGLDDLAAIGTDDGKNPDNNAHCTTRYGDFRLTVTYTFPIKKPDIPSETYPLVCRGIETLKVADVDGPVGFRWIGFTFIPGTKPAGEGLLPGQCSWVDRGMRAGEPHRVAQPIEGAAAWTRDLDSSDSYWTFYITTNVYNPREQLQAAGSKRNKFVIPLRTNYALASNGATARASTTMTGSFSPGAAIDGDRKGLNPLKGGVWVSAGPTNNDWLQVDFNDSKTIDEIDVFMVQDDYASPIEPSLDTPSHNFGLTDFRVQFLNQFGDWKDVPASGNPVTGNMNVLKRFTFTALRTRSIRVQVSRTPDGYSRLTEVEAWGK